MGGANSPLFFRMYFQMFFIRDIGDVKRNPIAAQIYPVVCFSERLTICKVTQVIAFRESAASLYNVDQPHRWMEGSIRLYALNWSTASAA